MDAASVDHFSRVSHGSPTSGVGLFAIVVFLFFFVNLLVMSGTALLNDPDTAWHIVVGGEIWRTGSFPQTDQFSWTFAGKPWIAKEWLSQVILFASYQLGGWRGVVVLGAATLGLTCALLFIVLAQRMRITIAILIVLAAGVLSYGHYLARPHVLSFPLVVIWVAGLVRAVEERTTPHLALLVVMALWANLHAGFTLGLAVAGGLAAEAVFTAPRAERVRLAFRWALFLAAALAAACLTPYGYQPLLITFQLYGGQPVEHIMEWAPLSSNNGAMELQILLGLLFLALYFGVRIRFWRLVLTLGLLALAFMHVRMISMFGFIAPILVASSLIDQFRFLRLETHVLDDPRLFRIAQRLSTPPVHLLLGCVVLTAGALYMSGKPISPPREIRPVAAVDYLQQANLSGRLFNHYGFGGYLIDRGVKTFIDGRIDQLFLGGFLDNVLTTIRMGEFVRLLDEHDISLVLVPPGSLEARQLDPNSGWKKLYSDEIASLYTRAR